METNKSGNHRIVVPLFSRIVETPGIEPGSANEIQTISYVRCPITARTAGLSLGSDGLSTILGRRTQRVFRHLAGATPLRKTKPLIYVRPWFRDKNQTDGPMRSDGFC